MEKSAPRETLSHFCSSSFNGNRRLVIENPYASQFWRLTVGSRSVGDVMGSGQVLVQEFQVSVRIRNVCSEQKTCFLKSPIATGDRKRKATKEITLLYIAEGMNPSFSNLTT